LQLAIGTGRVLDSGEYPFKVTVVALKEPENGFSLRHWLMERPTTAERTIMETRTSQK